MNEKGKSFSKEMRNRHGELDKIGRTRDLLSEVARGFVPGPPAPYVSNRFGADVIFASQVDAWSCESLRRFEGRFVLEYLDNLISGKNGSRTAFSLLGRWNLVLRQTV